jgi:hypothetical protein
MMKKPHKEPYDGVWYTTHDAEYTTWVDMKSRCNNPNHKRYWQYGGKGITVCERWNNSYKHFIEDMGHRPTDTHSLDRYPDRNGNYEKSNCRWATPAQQIANRDCTIRVSTKWGQLTFREIEEKSGIKYHVLKYRHNKGLTGDDLILPAPVRTINN